MARLHRVGMCAYMLTNEFSLNADFMVPGDVFQAIIFLAIADYADTPPVTFECHDWKGSYLFNKCDATNCFRFFLSRSLNFSLKYYMVFYHKEDFFAVWSKPFRYFLMNNGTNVSFFLLDYSENVVQYSDWQIRNAPVDACTCCNVCCCFERHVFVVNVGFF